MAVIVPGAVVIAFMLVLIGAFAATDSMRLMPRRFVVYDNTQYLNVDLEKLGLVRSAIVEETRTQAARIAAGQLPDKVSFQHAVAAASRVPGPLVLDYEDLYLRGSARTATSHLRMLTTLSRWARAAAPGKEIGFYGLLDHTETRYVALARRLGSLEDAFFPSLYTHDGNRRKWLTSLQNDVELAHQIAPGKPVYLYLWPQYRIGGIASSAPFIDAGYWAFELSAARRYADGVVVWSKRVENTSSGWIRVTANFMRELSGSRLKAPAGG